MQERDEVAKDEVDFDHGALVPVVRVVLRTSASVDAVEAAVPEGSESFQCSA
jgi:hypothetical protein